MIEPYISVEFPNKQNFPYALFIRKSLLDKIGRKYSCAPHWEVGGILFGRISEIRKKIIIEQAEPIRGRRCFSLAYIRDSKKAQKAINALWKETQGEMNYIGEWHTHPNISPTPSQRDKRTIVELTMEKKSNYFPYTILLIMGKEQKLSVTISAEKGIVECINIL